MPVGSYAIATALSYAPVRFAMDFLRLPDTQGGDPRYASLTPAQWCCFALFVFGAGDGLLRAWLKKKGLDPAEAVPEPYKSSAIIFTVTGAGGSRRVGGVVDRESPEAGGAPPGRGGTQRLGRPPSAART